MFMILITITTISLTSALNPAENVELANDKIKNILNKYLTNIPDIEEHYIVDERLSGAISRFFKGKFSSFPLYKISLKIDRNPVKIPWTLGDAKLEEPEPDNENRHVQKLYKYQTHVNGQDVRNIKLYGDISNTNSMEIKNRLSSKAFGKTVKNRGSLSLPEEQDKSKNIKIQQYNNTNENKDAAKGAKLSEEPDKIQNIEFPKTSEKSNKTKNIQASNSADETVKAINVEAAKSSEQPDKSTRIETDKLHGEADESILSTTDNDDLIGETTEATTIIKLA